MTDDSDALTLCHGRVAVRLEFSKNTIRGDVAYWITALIDDRPMFDRRWFRRLDHEIADGQPLGSVFALDGRRPRLLAAVHDPLDRGRIGRWQSDLPEVAMMIVPGGLGLPSFTQRPALADGLFDVIFAFHVAKPGPERFNCQDAGPAVRLTVPRDMLQRFATALGAGIDARVGPDPEDILFAEWDREPGDQ